MLKYVPYKVRKMTHFKPKKHCVFLVAKTRQNFPSCFFEEDDFIFDMPKNIFDFLMFFVVFTQKRQFCVFWVRKSVCLSLYI